MPLTINPRRLVALMLATSFTAAFAFAAATPPAAPTPARAPKAVNPLYERITSLLEAERTQLVVLRARLDQAGTSDAATALEREIEQVKAKTEVAVMRLQSDHARANGRPAVADRIDAAIREMLQPKPRAAARTAPTASSTNAQSR